MGMTNKVDLSAEKKPRKPRVIPELEQSARSKEISEALVKQFNDFHSTDHRPVKKVEEILFRQATQSYHNTDIKMARPDNMMVFSPSGASKCKRELFYKGTANKPREHMYPYQRRWCRNSSAIHEAVQKDLLYMEELMDNPDFTVVYKENGLPAWEDNLKAFVTVKHNGEEFAILGMMDGILQYKDGAHIGFEYKTKSNSIGQVGNWKMREPAPYHLEQVVAYSLLFGMGEFLLMYEGVAKDQWGKGAEAKLDLRVFYHEVTGEESTALLDKFADVSKSIKSGVAPEKEPDKCMFCTYKYKCNPEQETEGEKTV